MRTKESKLLTKIKANSRLHTSQRGSGALIKLDMETRHKRGLELADHRRVNGVGL